MKAAAGHNPACPTTTATQRFTVAYDYPVSFTRGVFAPENCLLEATICRLGENRRHRVMAFFDQGLVRAGPDLLRQCATYFEHRQTSLELAAPPLLVDGGEAAKDSLDQALRVIEEIAGRRLCRQSVVLAVGGGSFLDIVGFAASLVHRGVRLVRVPSSTLAQGDGGVGVKNGLDMYGTKNFLGTFAPPFAVINDLDLLHSLPARYWRGGFAEAWKVAVIRDAAFFNRLDKVAGDLARRDEQTAEEVLRHTADLHLRHIRSAGDPFETGSARPLDFGHWSAHALERFSQYELGHGEAVSIGMSLDACNAVVLGLLAENDARRLVKGLRRTGLPTWSPLLERRNEGGQLKIMEGLAWFREHLGGGLHLTLPNSIGRAIEVHELAPPTVEAAIALLVKLNHQTATLRAAVTNPDRNEN